MKVNSMVHEFAGQIHDMLFSLNDKTCACFIANGVYVGNRYGNVRTIVIM
jgi:hypothetical protein